MGGGRSELLDVVRGIAIGMVVVCHYAPGIADVGKLGVCLFFVLSGYLIGGILLDNRGLPGFFLTFYWRRAFRILPLYWLFLALWPHPMQPMWWYLVFGQNFGWVHVGAYPVWNMVAVTWSLAIEEQFYLVLPAMVAFLPRPWLIRALWACVIAAPVWRVLLGSTTPAAWLMLPCHLDSLMGGVLIACFKRGYAKSTAAWACLAVMAPALDVITTSWAPWSSVPHYSVIAIGFAAFMLFCLHLPQQRLTILRPVAWLGLGAYSIYLFHMPALMETGSPFIALPLALVMAWLSWRYIEAPLIGFARARWRYGYVAARAPAPIAIP